MPNADAQMAKLVDALVSGASAARLAGSSPVLGTKSDERQSMIVARFIFMCYLPSKLAPIATTPPLLKHCG